MKINVATATVADPDAMSRFVAAQIEMQVHGVAEFTPTAEGWESPDLTNYGTIGYVMIVLNRTGIAFTPGPNDLPPLF